MSDQEQWTPGVLPSDAKIGTDDPEEEAAQIEGQLALDDDGDDVSEDAAG
jgi:hypothetical protein